MMGLHGADLSTDENKTENPTDSDEEAAYFMNQRKNVQNKVPIVREKLKNSNLTNTKDLRREHDKLFKLRRNEAHAASDSCHEESQSYFDQADTESPRVIYDHSHYSEFSRMIQTNSDRKTCPNTLADLSETIESRTEENTLDQTSCSEFSTIEISSQKKDTAIRDD